MEGKYTYRTAVTCSTPLHIAAEVGAVDIVKMLIERGADVAAKDKGNYICNIFIYR